MIRRGIPDIRAWLTARSRLVLPVVAFIAFWFLAIVGWRMSGYLQPLLLFGYIGSALGAGLGLYATLPKRRKQVGRRLTLVLVGGMLLIFVGIVQRENVQIEWVFFSLLAGLGGAALTHYLIAKVLGPLLFGRLWCGWACWTLMVLDLLPFKRSPGRVSGHWDRLRYLHFGLSLGLVLLLWFSFGYRDQVHFGSTAGLAWMLVGNGLYYIVAVGMAFALKDNRAFCKYVCPVTVVLKTTSRFSLLKIEGDHARCTANIYLCREAFECDVVKILDFGLAKRIVPAAKAVSGRETRTDVIAGTPAYLAPEAISGQHTLDRRSDIYALGCVAHWLLTGRLVFESDSPMAMLAAHLERAPAPPGSVSPFSVPPLLDGLIMDCLAKSPDDRPASAEEVALRLRTVPLESPWTQEDAAKWWSAHVPEGVS